MKHNVESGEFHPYPHMKLTGEAFPRLLATRRLADDGAEYFGAFLNRTAVRIMIDLLNRTFRLRTCDIPIDGSFAVPCTQYYARRCVAPCVASLCTESEYEKQVELVRLFLKNERGEFRSEMLRRIEAAAGDLEFEKAAVLRDVLKTIGDFWENPRYQIWLDDTVDTYGFDDEDAALSFFLVTQRLRRTLGTHVFKAYADPEFAGETLGRIIESMYQFYAPREIRVPADFEGRRDVAHRLSERFGREISIKIVPQRSLGITAGRALHKKQDELHLSVLAKPETVAETAANLKKIFTLAAIPKQVEAHDVAHISSTSFVAARIVHDIHDRRIAAFEYLNSTKKSEPAALAELVARREIKTDSEIGLILVDGGRTQLNAAVAALGKAPRTFKVISAVKPPGRHSEISHFLTEDGRRVEFDVTSGTHRLLLAVRDEVHELANSVHRLTRDMAGFYDLAGILPSIDEATRQMLIADVGSIRRITEMTDEQIRKMFGVKLAEPLVRDLENYRSGNSVDVLPLIVPIRYDEFAGGAGDLRPILTRGDKT
ncbi:MAG: hypothetical protein ABI791_11290 [Acidobacteriota bacterium]